MCFFPLRVLGTDPGKFQYFFSFFETVPSNATLIKCSKITSSARTYLTSFNASPFPYNFMLLVFTSSQVKLKLGFIITKFAFKSIRFPMYLICVSFAKLNSNFNYNIN